jgi:hypothetical protein
LATFQEQVEGITSLSVGTTPTVLELDQFLIDGVKEVVNRVMKYDPTKARLFSTTTTATDANGTAVDSGIVLSVTRENGTAGNDEPASPISASHRYRATDVTSLHYRTKYNPGWYILDGKVYIVPDPSTSGNSADISYVTYDATIDSSSDSDFANMPSEYEYLVVLYACMKTLQAVMGNTTLSDLTVSAVAPNTPTLTSVTYNGPASDLDSTAPTVTFTAVAAADTIGTTTAPTYNTQSVTTQTSFEDFFNTVEDGNPFGDSDPETLIITSVAPNTPTVPDFELSPATTLPTYSSTLGSEFTELGTFIDTDEDVELANAKMGEIQSILKKDMDAFNGEVQKFQIEIQRLVQESQHENQAEFQAELSKYQADISEYQANVNAEVQEYSQNLSRYQQEMNTAYQAWGKTESDNIAIFQAEIQNELNLFNDANVEYQAGLQESFNEFQAQNAKNLAQAQHDLQTAIQNEDRSQQRQLQNAINNMQATVNDNQQLIAKYQADIQEYQASVATEVQEYQQNVQADGIGYQWLQDQYNKIKTEYDTAFIPLQQPQQGAPTRG